MKKVTKLSVVASMLLSAATFAQSDKPALETTTAPAKTEQLGVMIDVDAGVRMGGNNSSEAYTMDATNSHAQVNVGYMINEAFGIRVGYGRDQFNSVNIENELFTSNSAVNRVYAELVWNAGSTLGFNSGPFGLNVHAGGGAFSIRNKQYRTLNVEFGDKGIKGNDDGYAIIAGLTPTIRIDEGFYFNIDFAYHMLMKQSAYIETISREAFSGTAGYMTLGAGFSVRF